MAERPILFSAPMVQALLAGRKTMTRRLTTNRAAARIEVGDVLWVKEAWAADCIHDATPPRGIQPTLIGRCWYRADGDIDGRLRGKWRSSLFMPRWASRISLLVTGKRTERAHDISEADALADGIGRVPFYPDDGFPLCDGYMVGGDDGKSTLYPTAREAFVSLWRSINGSESWDANPEVFAFTFERVESPAREGGR